MARRTCYSLGYGGGHHRPVCVTRHADQRKVRICVNWANIEHRHFEFNAKLMSIDAISEVNDCNAGLLYGKYVKVDGRD